jgi:phospholipid N-methyltransferase
MLQSGLRCLFLLATAVSLSLINGFSFHVSPNTRRQTFVPYGWVEGSDNEWEWVEDDPNYVPPPKITATSESEATPTLPSGAFKPKQSLGQNFLRDGNTVTKILKAFHKDATRYRATVDKIVELGPGAGALTDPLVKTYGTNVLQCIELDPRSVELLAEKHPNLHVRHQDVLQVDYPKMAQEVGQPLVVFGNLPYYITSQILFALADASHFGAVDCATVTMQWEVAQRMVASISTKDYGILSVVFQLYGKIDARDVNFCFSGSP